MASKKKTVAFFMRHFTGRGVERSIYDYAHYNETILGNKSYIFAFTPARQAAFQDEVEFSTARVQVEEFRTRFGQIIELNDFSEMHIYISLLDLDFFYTQVHGREEPLYQFGDKEFWGKCRTIKHCAFHTRIPEADFNLSISQFLNLGLDTNLPVLPLMAPFADQSKEELAKVGGEGAIGNMRAELGIPEDAIVFGRYGAYDQFDIPITHNAIYHTVNQSQNAHIYFIFMNTAPLFSQINNDYYHPNIRYLPFSSNIRDKMRFINTCDAMIHARKSGETFGLAVAEFSLMNKPIITTHMGDVEHLLILKEKAMIYANDRHLYFIFTNFRELIKWNKENDWNAYNDYVPEKVMQLFDHLVFSHAED